MHRNRCVSRADVVSTVSCSHSTKRLVLPDIDIVYWVILSTLTYRTEMHGDLKNGRAQTVTESGERRQGHSARKFRQCGGERAVRKTPLAATGARHTLSSIRGSHLQPRLVFVTTHVRANIHGSFFPYTFYYMSCQY